MKLDDLCSQVKMINSWFLLTKNKEWWNKIGQGVSTNFLKACPYTEKVAKERVYGSTIAVPFPKIRKLDTIVNGI